MTKECPSVTDPVHCVRCRSVAQELLVKGDLNDEERARVKAMLMRLRDDSALDDESRDELNDFAARYLE